MQFEVISMRTRERLGTVEANTKDAALAAARKQWATSSSDVDVIYPRPAPDPKANGKHGKKRSRT